MSVVKWEQVRLDFAYDGALRDIYVLGTDLPDWQAVLDIMRTFTPPPIFIVDAAVSDLPYNAETIMNLRASNSPLLKISLGVVTLHSHFFTSKEIDFDLNGEALQSQQDLDAVLNFMRLLGKVTSKVVILTPEERREHPILRYEPSSGKILIRPATTCNGSGTQ